MRRIVNLDIRDIFLFVQFYRNAQGAVEKTVTKLLVEFLSVEDPTNDPIRHVKNLDLVDARHPPSRRRQHPSHLFSALLAKLQLRERTNNEAQSLHG